MNLVEFEIEFEGNVGGVESHRLSLAAFRDTLPKLLDALRYSAEMVATTAAPPQRIGRIGKGIDLQLESIGEGSLKLRGVVAVMLSVAEYPELPDIAARATTALVQDIRREATVPGGSGNRKVGEFFSSLPPGLKSHSYSALVDGAVVDTATVEETEKQVRVTPPPRMRTVSGVICSVTFTTGKERVGILTSVGNKYVCHVSKEVLEMAMTIRDEPVTATIIFDSANDLKNLVNINSATSPPRVPTDDEQWEHIRTVWGEVMKRLA